MASQKQSTGDIASLACYLPSVRDAAVPNPKTCRRMCSRISCDAQKLRTIFMENDESAKNLIRVAWAMVLHQYTGQEEVCFGYDEFDMAVSARKPGPAAVKIRVDPEAKMEEMMERRNGKYSSAGLTKLDLEKSKSQLHYNTAVMLQIRNSAENGVGSIVSSSQQAVMALPDEVRLE